ncbi:MAG: hypothetical protein LBR20_05025 [Propionibacteriaceae bacterium]|jgi:hypothetical protein|nr:hypothetical protein [Propionibacteriaceae bacterium]
MIVGKRVLRAGVSLLLPSVLLAGCYPVGGGQTMDESEVKLGDTVLALYATTQSMDEVSVGYVMLFDAEGEVKQIQTKGMDNGMIGWDDNGLFFADTERDFRLDQDGLTAWESPKSDFQDALFRKPDGSGYVALYNLGFDDDLGYTDQVVDTTGNSSQVYEMVGWQRVAGWCDGSMYGISEAAGPYIPLAQAQGATERETAFYWPDVLTQLYPKPDSAEAAYRSVRPDQNITETAYYAQTNSCSDGSLITINEDDTTDKGWVSSVTVWPVDGGTPVTHEMDIDPEIASFAQTASWSPDPQHVVWLGGDGIVRSTNTTDGTSTELWDSETDFGATGSSQATFVGDTVFIFHPTGEANDGNMQLTSHNLTTGETRDILTTSHGVGDDRFPLLPRGIAVNPNLTTK